jgi:SRSO17 transposase
VGVTGVKMFIAENGISKQPILIIEDNDEDYQTILWSIKKLPSHPPVLRCEDGDDALDYLNQRGKYSQQKFKTGPSLVFLDLNLPGKDGHNVLVRIKKDPNLKTMPIVVFTSSSNPTDVEQSYLNGANSYIHKPIDLESFKKTIQLTLQYWLGTVQSLPKKPDNVLVAQTLERLPTLQDFFSHVASQFLRPETRSQALAYLVSLLSNSERKNCWQLAAQAGDSNPARMQRLLSHARWDVDQVLSELRDYIVEQLGHSEALVVLEEMSFQKKGDRSVGVLKQYSSDTEQIRNCQIGIFLNYVSPKGITLLDRELYLPAEWADDTERRFEAEVPEKVTYNSKIALAKSLLTRTVAADVPLKWVMGNYVFGEDEVLRGWLEEQSLPYILEITSQAKLRFNQRDELKEATAEELTVKPARGIRVATRKENEPIEAPTDEWKRLELGESQTMSGYYHWLLFQTSNRPQKEWRYWVAFGPGVVPFPEMIRAIEQYATTKTYNKTIREEVGLSHYEVRSWQGWYRHITLAMIAQMCYAVEGDTIAKLK